MNHYKAMLKVITTFGFETPQTIKFCALVEKGETAKAVEYWNELGLGVYPRN